MPKTIKIKKGLNIPIEGNAPETLIGSIKSDLILIYPEDFPGMTPKMIAKVGDQLKIGTPVFFDKNHPEIMFVSPISGVLISINRGEKRRLLSIAIKVDSENSHELFDVKDYEDSEVVKIKKTLQASGLWPFIRQRPYDTIANPNNEPRDIFITGFSSAPLAPSYDYILEQDPINFQTGLNILSKLTKGKTYLGIGANTNSSILRNAKNVEIYNFEGPHPSGNVGVHINQIKPINKGECVWTINAPDVAFIGRLFNNGYLDFTRLIAYTGSEAVKKGYYKLTIGASLSSLTNSNITKGVNARVISGNVLTGTKVNDDGHLRFYDTQITVIPEGSETNEMFGWALPGFNKFSAGRTYLSKLFSNKKYKMDARLLGGRRAIIMSNQYEKVFPLDIHPEFLVKATIAYDIDKMEALGIYEVAPEDFALCEFVDTSKLELQKIIRAGLLQLKKEME